MKNILLLALITTLLSCQKQRLMIESLEGTWELRHVLGVQVAGAPSHFEKGNGNVIEFSGNRYKKIKDGKVYTEGTYTIVKDSAEIDGNNYRNRIVFDDETWNVFIKISGNQILVCTGPIA